MRQRCSTCSQSVSRHSTFATMNTAFNNHQVQFPLAHANLFTNAPYPPTFVPPMGYAAANGFTAPVTLPAVMPPALVAAVAAANAAPAPIPAPALAPIPAPAPVHVLDPAPVAPVAVAPPAPAPVASIGVGPLGYAPIAPHQLYLLHRWFQSYLLLICVILRPLPVCTISLHITHSHTWYASTLHLNILMTWKHTNSSPAWSSSSVDLLLRFNTGQH